MSNIKIKVKAHEFKHFLENFEKKNHSILINTISQEIPIKLNEGFMKESKTGKIGLELFTTFKKSQSKKDIYNSITSQKQIYTNKTRNENTEYLDRRHFETLEKINQMRKQMYENNSKPNLSMNTLKICENLSNSVKTDYNLFYQNTKTMTRNSSKDGLNSLIKLTANSFLDIKNDKKIITNSSVNLDNPNMNNPLTRNLLKSKFNNANKELESKKNSLATSNSFSNNSYKNLFKRINELNNIKDHLMKLEEITEKKPDILMKSCNFDKITSPKDNNINSILIINDMTTQSK